MHAYKRNDELGSLYERGIAKHTNECSGIVTQASKTRAARGMEARVYHKIDELKIALQVLSQRGNLEAERTQKVASLARN